MGDSKRQQGLIHIYTGDGKGKTTAAVGLALRFAGTGGKSLFAQFLKDGSSGEITSLKQIPGVEVYSFAENLGFSFQMDEQQKKHAAKCYTEYLRQIIKKTSGKPDRPAAEKTTRDGSTDSDQEKSESKEPFGLLVLDEILTAYNLNFIDRSLLLSFLKHKPEQLEVVMTGRDPAQELISLADYVSEIKKIKHPFDEGITARPGIEY